MAVLTLAFTLWALSGQAAVAPSSSPASDLASAKTLYASGAYEDALAKLTALRGAIGPGGGSVVPAINDEVDEYRALCLLALGRTADAEKSLGELVARKPLFKMSDPDVSPRLVAMFHDIRKRLLPDAVRDLYVKAKTSFEQQHFEDAAAQFKDLSAMLTDEDLAGEDASLSDLKLIAPGFLKLAEAQIAAKAAAAPAAPPDPPAAPKPDPASADPSKTVEPPGVRVYTSADSDVKPPVEVSCPYPEWNPPDAASRKFERRGALRIVIDETGKVEAASVVVSISPAYDTLLAAAAKLWQYRPATRNGQAVKYQKVIAVTLSPK